VKQEGTSDAEELRKVDWLEVDIRGVRATGVSSVLSGRIIRSGQISMAESVG